MARTSVPVMMVPQPCPANKMLDFIAIEAEMVYVPSNNITLPPTLDAKSIAALICT